MIRAVNAVLGWAGRRLRLPLSGVLRRRRQVREIRWLASSGESLTEPQRAAARELARKILESDHLLTERLAGGAVPRQALEDAGDGTA